MANKFIPYSKLQELTAAAKGGNQKAKDIIDKYMMPNPDMDSIGRLLDDYYKPESQEIPNQSAESIKEPETDGMGQEEPPAEAAENPSPIEGAPDISADLSRDLDGLIDSGTVDGESFQDYIAAKKRDALRAKKNRDYFQSYDQGGRGAYIEKAEKDYSDSYLPKRRKLEQTQGDIGKALAKYKEMVTDLPDDGSRLDMDVASKAYDDFTSNEGAKSAFGRYWDEADMESMRLALQSLVQQYGKQNVAAVLNTLQSDCDAWGKRCSGEYDQAIAKYGKSLSDLLK